MNGQPAAAARILVAVGPAADAAALAMAARCARAVRLELAAFFIEDANLLRLAELPFAFEVGAGSACARPLTAADLERAFHRQATVLRGELAAMAQAAELRASLRVARGLLLPTLLGAASAEDLVVLAAGGRGTARRFAPAAPLPATLRLPAPAAARPLLALVPPAAGAARVLAVAQRLADGLGAALSVLAPEDGDDGPHAQARDEALVRWQAGAGAAARVRRPAPDALAGAIAAARPQALLWPDGGAADAAALRRLLDAIDCPLIVVR